MTYQEQPQSRVPQAVPQAMPQATGDGAGEPTELACPHLPRVSLYHDRELNDDDRRELAEHLATCHACAEELAFFGRVTGAFVAAAPERLDPQSRQRLRSLASGPRDADGEDVAAPAAHVPAHVRWVRRLTAVAAVLFLVAVCRLAFQHQTIVAPNGTPVDNPTSPILPVKPPETTGQDFRVPQNPNHPSGESRKRSSDAPAKAPSTSPAAPSVG